MSKRMRKALVVVTGLFISGLGAASVAIAESTTTYQYDALGRLILVTYPNGGTVTYSYDAAGNRTQVVGVAGTDTTTAKVVVLPLLGGLILPVP